MALRQGHPVGRADVSVEGHPLWLHTVAVYEALQPQRCDRCRRVIPVGDRYTRRLRPTLRRDGGPVPTCRRCVPFPDPLF